MLDSEQAAVRRIQVGEQGVLDIEPAKALRFAASSEAHDSVGAVAVLVDEVLDRGKRARPLVGADPQPRKCVGGNLGVPGAHLAPPYRAVAVAIQANRVFEVAQ